MSLVAITVPVLSTIILSLIFRRFSNFVLLAYLISIVIVSLAIIYYLNFSTDLGQPSLFVKDNFRVIFLCFLGGGASDLIYSIYEEITYMSEK